MSFLDNLDSFVKLPAFLQFVGLMILALCMFFSGAGIVFKIFGFIGFGVSLAGFIYDRIYQ